MSSTCPHSMVNWSPLAAEIISLVWGTPANFNGFHVLASLLQRRRSTEASQTFHSVWPLPGLLDYIYIFCELLLDGILPGANKIHFASSRSCALLLAARQSSSGREPNFAALSTGRHLYSAGRPSHWTLAHILVLSITGSAVALHCCEAHSTVNYRNYKTKLESVSLSCKSHRFETANIEFLSANSTHRC